MKIDPDQLAGKSIEGILRVFIGEVTKTGEEAEEKETRGGKTTDLKIYIVDTSEKILGELENVSQRVLQDPSTRKYAEDFFQAHVITEKRIRDDVWWLEITTQRYERTDEFAIIKRDGFLWILTTERKDWCEDTLEKLVKYTPSLERVFLPSEDLEGLMNDVDDSELSGFTAKYHSAHLQKDATLRFHGAEPEDLSKAERTFGATPTRIEFDQTNSPSTAIQGSGSNDGMLTVESVRKGSEPKATKTFFEISDRFTDSDSASYEIETDSSWKTFEAGFVVDEFTTVELHDPNRESPETLGVELEENVLNKQRYQFGHWGEDVYFVYDKFHEEVFEVGIESPDIAVHARESTTALSLRSFCKIILEEFDSTYSIRKKETRVGF